jgi:hypothetical protein
MSKRGLTVRRQLYESRRFREEVAERLCLDCNLVTHSVNALVETDLIPNVLSFNAKSLAADGATILMAIGSQQSNAESVARAAARFGSMALQAEVAAAESEIVLCGLILVLTPGRRHSPKLGQNPSSSCRPVRILQVSSRRR